MPSGSDSASLTESRTSSAKPWGMKPQLLPGLDRNR